MLLPFFRHWYVNPDPVAITVNVAGSPITFDIPEGCTAIDGGRFTLSLARVDVSGGGQLPVTITSYAPVSATLTALIVNVAEVALEIFPLFERLIPFFLQ